MLVLPNKSGLVWHAFMERNKPLVYKYIVKQIKQGIAQQLTKVELFRFEGASEAAWIPAENYLSVLNDAISIFVEHEDYESAAKVKSVIDSYHVHKLINEKT